MKPTESRPPRPHIDTLRPATGGPAGTPLALPVERLPFEKRFREEVLIGRGGMSVVMRTWDKVLQRWVAMKFLPPGAEAGAALAEARIAAGLQHPGVVPVYEVGELDDGRKWLAMPEITGLDLQEALDRAVRGDDAWPRRRLLEIFRRLCETMAFVHARGCVHRDIKPSNVRVGDYGEVVVLDWGIAGRVGEERGRSGTEGYAAPEQSTGAPLDPRMDVFALGRLLGRILERLPDSVDDERLLRLVERATRPDPEERPLTAQPLAEEMAGWLDNARRRAEGREMVREARRLIAGLAELRNDAARLRTAASAALDAVPQHAPAEQKMGAWRQEDAARGIRGRIRRTRLEYERLLQEARRRADDLPEARRALADYYRERVAEADLDRDPDMAEEYEARLREIDDGTHAEFLEGLGALTLLTDPPGAEVWAARYMSVDRRLVPGPERLLGRTPLVDHPIGRGSWRLRLVRPGCAEVIYPVLIERGGRWDGVRPGGREPHPIALPPTHEIAPDERYVPAGWFLAGGDPLAMDGLPRRRIWLDGFVMMRDPLTYRDLIADLDALWQADRPGLAHDIASLLTTGRRVPGLKVELGPSGYRVVPDDPEVPVLDWPVAQMDWFAATSWARCRAERTGRPWRLPHDLEREKATRGTDGRLRAWGDFLDPTWANVHGSHAGPPRLCAVDAFPSDVSPYGIRGVTGNIRDWCCNGYRRYIPASECGPPSLASASSEESHRMARGGGWASNPDINRAASRYASPPDTAPFQIGVRPARSWPE